MRSNNMPLTKRLSFFLQATTVVHRKRIFLNFAQWDTILANHFAVTKLIFLKEAIAYR